MSYIGENSSIDPFAKHYSLPESGLEASAEGMTKMFFYNMLKPMFEEITKASMSPEEHNNIANYLWHEAFADSLVANEKIGLKDAIKSYITRQYGGDKGDSK